MQGGWSLVMVNAFHSRLFLGSWPPFLSAGPGEAISSPASSLSLQPSAFLWGPQSLGPPSWPPGWGADGHRGPLASRGGQAMRACRRGADLTEHRKTGVEVGPSLGVDWADPSCHHSGSGWSPLSHSCTESSTT